MLVLTKQDIQKIFTMQDAIQSSKDALRLYTEGKSNVPLRLTIDIPKEQGLSLFMPAYVEELNALGIKIVSVFPKNNEKNIPSVPSKMILMDGETGDVHTVMDGTYLTQLRTGALQGAATDILARKDAKIAALFGVGGQARTQLEAMLTVRKLDEVRITATRFDRAHQFAADMQKEFAHFKTTIHAVKHSHEAVNNADIITAATTSKTPVFDGSLVKKGAHINGIGSFTPEMQEIPENAVLKANKIIFDTTEGVLSEAGDILIPMKAGTLHHFDGELGDIILEKVKGRETEHEITLFKAVGTAVLDVVMAAKIYQKAMEYRVGQRIDI